MGKSIRFGDYLHEVGVHSSNISYSHLMPRIQVDARGNEIPYVPPKLQLKPSDVYHLLSPYVGTRFFEQVKAVVPLVLYLALFQWLVLRQPIADSIIISAGFLGVIVGLMLFLEGLKLGLMPFGETIGDNLPRKAALPVVLVLTFILGVGVTFAEPAIGALQAAGSIVDPQKAPYLYLLLTQWSTATVMVVGIGVGIAAVMGTLRFIHSWSLKPLIYASVVPTLLITIYAQTNPHLKSLVGLAWDCGAVTTGPVTVPLVLSLGVGVAAAISKGGSSLSGFGIVTLASIFPILGVLLLGIYAVHAVSPEAIIAGTQSLAIGASSLATAGWWETTPGVEVVMSVRAIVPLVMFLFFILIVILKEKLANRGIIWYGLSLAVIGMIIFNIGLTYGLSKLGSQSGGLIPGAFTHIDAMSKSPLFGYIAGVMIAFGFAWVLGFGATLAEPALNALGLTVENLTSGAFKRSLLMYAVAAGVAFGISIGVLKIIFDLNLTYMLLGLYALALILTYFSTEEFVNVSWDSAGVTTGPVTVPLVLAMGLGFAKAVGAVEGFGILAAASVCPIISVMSVGLYVQYKIKKANKLSVAEMSDQKGAVPV
ncbi:MAG: DUF1538 domain-containing protein [Chitinispirillaceae bacterium]|jgi:hypothetical protein|nr:DUF1538 domain-containing protein [Chitinispirillaceae bacterium]